MCNPFRACLVVFCLICGLFLAACDDDSVDHNPPAGMGSLVIYNRTGDDIRVFIDGGQLQNAGDYDETIYDLQPGVHRMVLDQEDGDRSFAEYVDVFEGRLTEVLVETDFSNLHNYVVSFTIEE